MSDLIDTPRDRGNFEELARRADKIRRQANEIERLTALADQIRTDWIPANRQLKARIDELEGAIKTAKGFIGPADGTMDAWIILSKALEGEVK